MSQHKHSVMCSPNVRSTCFVLGTIVVLHAVDGIHEQFPTAASSTHIMGPQRQKV